MHGSFLYPPVSFSSRSAYVQFWTTADVSDATLTNLVKARDRWRDEMVQAALSGDNVTRRVVEDAALSIGKVLGQLASLLNPQTILLGGPLSDLGDLLLEPVRRSMLRHTVPDIADATVVRISALRDRAEALGGAASVLSAADPADLYGPPGHQISTI